MARIINTRSPFYIKVQENTLVEAKLELKIWDGENFPIGNTKYVIQKPTIENNTYVVFEMSELIRDYIENKFDGNYNSNCVWVFPVITGYNSSGVEISEYELNIEPYFIDYFIATEGYGYFDEGINPDFERGLMIPNATLFRLSDSPFLIPVYSENTDSVVFKLNGVAVRTVLITDNNNTNQKIQYIPSDLNYYDSYRLRVLDDGGIFEDNSLLEPFKSFIDIKEIDEVHVNYTKTDLLDTGTHILKVKTLDCSKYEPIKVTFVNKFGALQDLYFTRRSNESLSIESNDYKASMMDFNNFNYDVSEHQKRTLNLVGSESVVLNTDYVDESYNQNIEQLFLSERVWMTRMSEPNKIIPLKLKGKTLNYKKSVNEKLVQYTVEFDLASDKINNIR